MQISEEESRATLGILSKHLSYQKGWDYFNSSSYPCKEMQIFVWVFVIKINQINNNNNNKKAKKPIIYRDTTIVKIWLSYFLVKLVISHTFKSIYISVCLPLHTYRHPHVYVTVVCIHVFMKTETY